MNKILTMIGLPLFLCYFLLKQLYSEGHETFFLVFRAVFITFTLVSLFRIFKHRDKSLGAFSLFHEIFRRKLGQSVADYLIFEVKMLIGSLKFFRTPLKSFGAISHSYFAGPILQGLVIGLLLMLAIEPLLIHILISAKFTGPLAMVLHSGLVVSEIYILQILFGNLYYLQFSEALVTERRLKIRMGYFWNLDIDLDNIKLIERGNVRIIGDKTAKIGLMMDPTVRLHFQSLQPAQKLFKKKAYQTMDVFLKTTEVQGLIENVERLRREISLVHQ